MKVENSTEITMLARRGSAAVSFLPYPALGTCTKHSQPGTTSRLIREPACSRDHWIRPAAASLCGLLFDRPGRKLEHVDEPLRAAAVVRTKSRLAVSVREAATMLMWVRSGARQIWGWQVANSAFF